MVRALLYGYSSLLFQNLLAKKNRNIIETDVTNSVSSVLHVRGETYQNKLCIGFAGLSFVGNSDFADLLMQCSTFNTEHA